MTEPPVVAIPEPDPRGEVLVEDRPVETVVVIEEGGGSDTPGPPGDSAYQIWLDQGNTGTEQDFLDSLQGQDGEDGQPGAPGAPSTVPGPPGPAGVSNAAYTGQWVWVTKTTDAQAAGQVGNNDSTNQWQATRLHINQQKDDNTDVTAHLALIEVGDRLRVQQKTDGTKWGDYEVNGAPIDRGAWWEFPVTLLASSVQEPNGSAATVVTHIPQNNAEYVNKGGDTMTGPLVLAGNAAQALHAVPKQQMDTATALLLPKTGGTLTGQVLASPTGTVDLGSTSLRFAKVWGTRFGNDTGQVFIDDGNGTIRLTSGYFEVTARMISQIRGILFQTDNTYDIGQAAAVRPRDVHVGRAVYINAQEAATKQYADTKWTMWKGTQAEFDAIGTKDPNTLYAITG